MPFHVEVRRGSFHHARAFNLDEARLRRGVLEPWMSGLPLILGERSWDPRDCALRVIEGPELSTAELGMGQGWNRAQRTGREATRELLAGVGAQRAGGSVPGPLGGPAVAVMSESLAAGRELSALLAEGGLHTIEWASVREQLLLEGSAAAPTWVVLLLDRAGASGAWLFDAGLAIGALGSRALVGRPGGASVPGELHGVGVVDLGPNAQAAAAELLVRLAGALGGVRGQ